MRWLFLGFGMVSLMTLTRAPLSGLLAVTCFGAWWAHDRSERGHPTTMGHLLLFVWLWPILLPAWMVRSRGVLGLVWFQVAVVVWASFMLVGDVLRYLVLGEAL